MTTRTDVVFLSHGGGPLPLLGDSGHRDMVARLQELAATLPRPDAILVVSAHWEAPEATVTAAARPSLIYDYNGFPPEAYEIQYPCPGAPALAEQVCQALRHAGQPARQDAERGLDHGVFVPLKLMYPAADIPVVQLSLADTLDAGTHLAMGRALRALDYDNLLVIGSGFSFHNMQAFFAPSTPATETANQAFEDWLADTCCDPALSETEREQRLLHWEQAPHARFCHPREEHLLPLHVCYGLAAGPSKARIGTTILGKQSGMFLWR